MSHPSQRYPADPAYPSAPPSPPPPPAPPPLRRRTAAGTNAEWPAASAMAPEAPMPSFEDGASYAYEEPELVIPLVPGPYAARGAEGHAAQPLTDEELKELEFTQADGRLARLKNRAKSVKERVKVWKKARPRAFFAAVVASVAVVSAASGYSVGAKPWSRPGKARPAMQAKAPLKSNKAPLTATRAQGPQKPAMAAQSRPAAGKPQVEPNGKPKALLAMAPGGAQLQPAALKLNPGSAAMPRSNVTSHLVANAKLGAGTNGATRLTNSAAPRAGIKTQAAPLKLHAGTPGAKLASATKAGGVGGKAKVATNAAHKPAIGGKAAVHSKAGQSKAQPGVKGKAVAHAKKTSSG